MARLYAEPIIWWILRTVLGARPFGFFFRLDAVYPPTVQQVLVESLQVQRSEVCQWNTADLRLDVVFQKTLRGFVGRWAQLDFLRSFPSTLPANSHGVGLGPSVVDTDVFLDGFFQFFFYFRLRLAEDVFDDGFASFRIVTDSVPAFPASILALSDVPFPRLLVALAWYQPLSQRTIP